MVTHPAAILETPSNGVPFPRRYPKSKLLEGLTEPEIRFISAAAIQRRVPANSVITNQEHPANRFFLLSEGVARHFYLTEAGRKVILLWLHPGDGFGGRALMRDSSTYLVGTESVRESYVLEWPRERIRGLFAKYPRFWENALSIASDYVTWFLSAHLALISRNARERLAHVVLSLVAGLGRETSQGVELDITNEELANAANVTLFTASRALSEWRRDGVLLKTRGKIVLRSSRQLLSYSSKVTLPTIHHEPSRFSL